MKRLMGASIVGENEGVVVLWSREGYLLCTEVNAGLWKLEELSREEAKVWCKNNLWGVEYRELFG